MKKTKTETQTVNDELLTAKEVQALLKISQSLLWINVNEGTIKSHRIGRRTIRFKRSEVMDSLKKNS